MCLEKLRLGLLLDSFLVPAWEYYSLERIVNSNYAEFVVIAINEIEPQEKSNSGFNKKWRGKEEIVYDFFNKIDEKIFLREPNAFKNKDLHEILSKVQVVLINPIRDEKTDLFKPDDVEIIRNFKPDLLVKMGFQELSGEILSVAKFGIWFYEHADNRKIRGGPTGFWEVVERWPETGSTLSIVHEFPQRVQAVYRSGIYTYPFSPARNRNVQYWESASFLSRQIKLLYCLGEEDFFKETAKFNCDIELYDHKQYCVPSNFQSIRIYTRLLARLVNEIFQRFSHLESWYLMFQFSKETSLSFATFREMKPPRDRFWADPHVIQKDGNVYIFVEEYLYKNGKGHIAVIEMDDSGDYKEPIPVLRENYHLSYPFIFEHQNKYYMVPESAQNNTVDLYECVDFPTGWKYKTSLMKNVKAVDTTIFFYDDKWWLFTGIAENEGALPVVELFLFYSDDLFSASWVSHPLNPVISDVSTARPAGKLFMKNGKIYRPSQDCSKSYGNGFNINEILCLSADNYQEKKVSQVKPNWDKELAGTHTFTRTETFVIIDGYSRRGKFF